MTNQAHLTSKEKKALPYELLVMYRQRSGLTQLQLAGLLGLKGERMVQLWEGGYYLPKATRLKKLIEVYLEQAIFIPGQEREEALNLWRVVKDLAEANSTNYETYPIFDEGWFASLMSNQQKEKENKNENEKEKIATVSNAANKLSSALQLLPSVEQKPEYLQPQVSLERGNEIEPPNNLPASTNLFIGRSQELEAVSNLVRKGDLRLLTLTGPGGIGKTRLALEVASAVRASFRNGVWLVELAPLNDPHLLPQLLIKVLGLKEPGSNESINQTLTDYLQAKKLLLVLDNCEHLIDSCADLVSQLLRTCPQLRILATSREALGLDSEGLWLVEPLPVQPSGQTTTQRQESLVQPDAVNLFLVRARAVSPTFSPGNEEMSAIVGICRLLDGIPLAIELAAARIKLLSTAQLLERLSGAFEERFGLLGGGRRALSSHQRHQTLKASLDWSYNLLPEEERRLFRRLCVFASSWSLEAAIVVGDDRETFEKLVRLVDKSLVVVEPVSHKEGGSNRYRMLETIRQYALARLEEAGEVKAVRERHLEFYLKMVEKLEIEAQAGGHNKWLAKLEVEHPNLRVALSWALAQEDLKGGGAGAAGLTALAPKPNQTLKALRLASALGQFWFEAQHAGEGREWLTKALEAVEKIEEQLNGPVLQARAKALKMMGSLASLQGEPATALKYMEEGLELYRKLENKVEVVGLLSQLATAAFLRSDDQQAAKLAEEAIKFYRELGDRAGLTWALNVLGAASTYLGKATAASTYLKEALSINQAINHQANLGVNIFELGVLAWTQGDLTLARKYLEESLAIRKVIGHNIGAAGSVFFLGIVAWTEGDYQQAIKLIEEGQALIENWRVFFAAGSFPLYLGLCYLDQGDYERARGQLEESLVLAQKTDDRHTMPTALEGHAFLFSRLGQAEHAARLWGAAEAYRERVGFPVFPVLKTRYEQERRLLIDQLGQERFTQEWEKGRGSGPAAWSLSLQF